MRVERKIAASEGKRRERVSGEPASPSSPAIRVAAQAHNRSEDGHAVCLGAHAEPALWPLGDGRTSRRRHTDETAAGGR